MRWPAKRPRWIKSLVLILMLSSMSCANNPPLPPIAAPDWPQISARYEELLAAAGEETYKAAYRYELALAVWAGEYIQKGIEKPFPKLPQALADLLKQGPDELKREAIKHQLDWQGWGREMGVINP